MSEMSGKVVWNLSCVTLEPYCLPQTVNTFQAFKKCFRENREREKKKKRLAVEGKPGQDSTARTGNLQDDEHLVRPEIKKILKTKKTKPQHSH